MDDTARIVAALRARFPKAAAPRKEDICYATTNRQDAVKRIAADCDLVLVLGSATSSNSARLVEVALKAGARDARLIDDASALDWRWFEGVRQVGLTAGASAPDILVDGVIAAINDRFALDLSEEPPVREPVTFKLPRVLAE